MRGARVVGALRLAARRGRRQCFLYWGGLAAVAASRLRRERVGARSRLAPLLQGAHAGFVAAVLAL
ncbi:hypothetical protein A7A76_23675 [Lysobacter enzymogenes]|nr:hypothetical protein [Lysobacter enzymogenes]